MKSTKNHVTHQVAQQPTPPFFNPKSSFLVAYVLFGILSYFYFDRPIAHFFLNIHWDSAMTVFLHFISDIALSWLYIMGLPICGAIAWRLDKKELAKNILFLFACVFLASLCATVLKITLGRARPHELFEYSHYGFYWFKLSHAYWSFPSGHAITISALMFGLCYLKPEKTNLFVTLAILTAALRLILTMHYLSDIMGAFLISYYSVKYCITYKNSAMNSMNNYVAKLVQLIQKRGSK